MCACAGWDCARDAVLKEVPGRSGVPAGTRHEGTLEAVGAGWLAAGVAQAEPPARRSTRIARPQAGAGRCPFFLGSAEMSKDFEPGFWANLHFFAAGKKKKENNSIVSLLFEYS